MLFKCVKYQNGYLILDTHADIRTGLIYDTIVNKPVDAGTLTKLSFDEYKKRGFAKIIAQSPELSIPDIPYVELEEDIEQLSLKEIPDRTTAGWIDSFSASERIGFIKGYKAAQAKKYSEDDVVKLMRWTAEMAIGMRDSGKTHSEISEQIDIKVESLQPKIVSIELQMEYDDPHPLCRNGVCQETKALENTEYAGIDMCEDGCVIAKPIPSSYTKDGKTFLIVNHINYE